MFSEISLWGFDKGLANISYIFEVSTCVIFENAFNCVSLEDWLSVKMEKCFGEVTLLNDNLLQ